MEGKGQGAAGLYLHDCNFHICTRSGFEGIIRVASIFWKLELDK